MIDPSYIIIIITLFIVICIHNNERESVSIGSKSMMENIECKINIK
jgi:hypothetical protein